MRSLSYHYHLPYLTVDVASCWSWAASANAASASHVGKKYAVDCQSKVSELKVLGQNKNILVAWLAD